MNLKPNRFLRSSVIIAGTLLLAGCASSSQFGNSNRNLSAPPQLSSVAGSSVQSEALPPLQGEGTNIAQSGIFDPNAPNNGGNMDFNSGDPMLIGNNNFEGQGVNSSFVNIDDVNSSNITPGGRDISGSLSVAKLLGTWNVNATQRVCRLNLTQTTKSGTNRYRASTPNCDILVLSLVSSWQLTGTQVQLFDASGTIVGAFQRSGNRFVGTLAGGIAASMDG